MKRYLLIRCSHLLRFCWLAVALLLFGCVDPYEPEVKSTVDVIVVDGTITNLAEPQIIRLNRSKADSLTGRFGTLPITKAMIEVVVDSITVITCHETINGTYQLPGDFKGQVGHAYQLRFTFSDGTRYVSSQQVMQAVPPIDRIYARFNPTSLPAQLTNGTISRYRGAHEVFIDWQDPADQPNYYRWEWKLWEKQEWCRSCVQGEYAQYKFIGGGLDNCFISGRELYEDCFYPPELQTPIYNYGGQNPYFVYDYTCRTQCWEIIYAYAIDVFDDRYSNGGFIKDRNVARIPFYQDHGCLIEMRQSSLTPDAHRYFKSFQDQTQNTGGVADTPPSAPVGNVRNQANSHENVVGYFTASAVSAARYWIDRKDAEEPSPGLFEALNGRLPTPEPDTAKPVFCITAPPLRPPTALCVPSDSRTPFKPVGWRDQ